MLYKWVFSFYMSLKVCWVRREQILHHIFSRTNKRHRKVQLHINYYSTFSTDHLVCKHRTRTWFRPRRTERYRRRRTLELSNIRDEVRTLETEHANLTRHEANSVGAHGTGDAINAVHAVLSNWSRQQDHLSSSFFWL